MCTRIRYWTETIVAHGGTVASVETGTHLKFKLGCGALLVVARTPSDWRGDLNSLAELRRLLNWRRPKRDQKSKEKTMSKRKDSFDTPAWEPKQAWRSPGPMKVIDEERRKRLGLEGSRVPKVKPAAQRRPVLTLSGVRSDPRPDDLRGVVVAPFEEDKIRRDVVRENV
jgi:hypothetical protein